MVLRLGGTLQPCHAPCLFVIIPLIVLRSTEFSASCGTKFKAPGNSTANVDIILDLVVLDLVLLVVLRHRYSSNGTRFNSTHIRSTKFSTSNVVKVQLYRYSTNIDDSTYLVLLIQLQHCGWHLYSCTLLLRLVAAVCLLSVSTVYFPP